MGSPGGEHLRGVSLVTMLPSAIQSAGDVLNGFVAEGLDYKNAKNMIIFCHFVPHSDDIWRCDSYTLFLMMIFFCCTE